MLAACCSVEVMKGAPGFVRVGLSSRSIDLEVGELERPDGLVRLGLVGRAEVLAAVFGDLEPERCASARPRVGVDLPVLLRDEGADLPLALDDQSHRDRLHAPRREPARDLRPQQRRDHVADDAVEEAPRLLRVDAGDVELTGRFEGLPDRLLGDLVEDHALEALRIAADRLAQVPGDRLALAVEVGREIDRVGLLRELAQLGDDLLLAGQDLVVGGPVVVGVDAHAREERLLRLLLAVLLALGAGELAGLRRRLGARLGIDLLARAATPAGRGCGRRWTSRQNLGRDIC